MAATGFDVLIQLLIQGIASGILFGGLLAALAVGLSLIWGVLRYINLPHMALAFIGIYVSYWIWNLYGIEPHVTLVITIPLLFVIGMAVQKFLSFSDRRAPNSSLVTLFAVLFLVEGGMVAVLSNRERFIDAWYGHQSLFIGNIALPLQLLFAFIAGTVLIVLNFLFLQRTYTGLAIRATAQDSEMALSMGINTSLIYMITFGLGMAVSAVGGLYLGMTFPFFPDLQFAWIPIIFAIVVLGGLGSIMGTFFGALIIGIIDSIVATFWSNAWAAPVSYAILIIILLLRPQGLFGRYR